MQSCVPVLELAEEVQGERPGAGVKAATGEPECAVRSLTGEAGGCASFPGAAEEGRGIVGRRGVEPGAVDGEDGDEGGGGVAVEAPGGAVASSPSCDPWMKLGC